MISNDVKDRIRSAINIVDLVGSYLELRRQGQGFVAVCPFHDDHKPSMQVNPNRQSWKCWVCDVGGDIFSFVMKREGVTFIDAIRMLADRAGVVLEQSITLGADDKKQLLDAMGWAVTEFHQNLLQSPSAEMARVYLSSRGISDESIKKFKIGYSPDSWQWLIELWAKRNAGSIDVLKEAGLVAASERGAMYDRFRGRIIFPINDQQSKPIAVGGRVTPNDGKTNAAKYVNCNETRLYHKSNQLYGLDLARTEISKTRQAVVMEGYTDVIMAFQHGIRNAVACCGTALGTGHIRLLKHSCDSVVLLLDGDEAGQKRTSEILELFVSAQMDLRVLKLPDNLDPCDYLIRFGGEKLKEQIAGAADALEFKLELACQGFDPQKDTHQANSALRSVLETMARVDSNSSESTKFRFKQMVSRVSRRFAIEESDIRTWIESIRSKSTDRFNQREELRKEQTEDPSQVRVKYSEMNSMESELFQFMVIDPAVAPLAIEKVPIDRLKTATARRLFATYMEAESSGLSLEFDSVMGSIDDPDLKSVLVSVEEHASMVTLSQTMTGLERLSSLLRLEEERNEGQSVVGERTEEEIERELMELEESSN